MNKQGPNGIEWTNFTLNPITGCWGPGGTAKNPKFHPHRLDALKKIKDPSMIFMCSASDMFGEWVPKEWILEILETVKMYPQHVFQFLTKNPKRYVDFDFPQNCWLGITVTSGDDWTGYVRNHYRKLMAGTAHNILFLSYEPMLDYDWYWDYTPKFNWLIMGAMTGQGAIKPEPQWITDAVKACREYGIPIFMKRSLKQYWEGSLIQEFPGEKNEKVEE